MFGTNTPSAYQFSWVEYSTQRFYFCHLFTVWHTQRESQVAGSNHKANQFSGETSRRMLFAFEPMSFLCATPPRRLRSWQIGASQWWQEQIKMYCFFARVMKSERHRGKPRSCYSRRTLPCASFYFIFFKKGEWGKGARTFREKVFHFAFM